MFKKEYRLCSNNDFMKVYKKGKRHSHSDVLLFYARNDTNVTRIGFVINKKFSPSAVKRNKQKRILRSVLEKSYHNIKTGIDIVISYTNRGNMLPYKEASSIINDMLHKDHLFKK